MPAWGVPTPFDSGLNNVSSCGWITRPLSLLRPPVKYLNPGLPKRRFTDAAPPRILTKAGLDE